MKLFTNKFHHQVSQHGFSLMEVLIGIAIFAIGMLALASLQGALTRSTAEAKVRTTAVNVAEQIIEGQRGFAQVLGGGFSFASIVDVPVGAPITVIQLFDGTVTRYEPGDTVPTGVDGITYTVTQDVTDYYYDLATDAFTETVPTGAVIPDYKTVVVNVAWNDDRNYVIDEGTQTTGNLGGGFVEVSATISNISVASAIQVAEQDDKDIIAPDIVYTPGANPDIVSLQLGPTKFKESLTPEPTVYRDNLETRFDVVTYSQSAGAAIFLRREEFVAVSCECTLYDEDESNQGKTPAIWAGDEYTEPELVTKDYGVPIPNVSQSSLCDTCCRDHHDGGGSALYDPSRPLDEYSGYDSSLPDEYSGGDHNHYFIRGGSWSVAGDGDDYIEACRFIRKDGFFRLTQDFRLEGLNTFQADYLITEDQVDDYSTYVTGEVYVKADLTTYVPLAILLDDGYQLHASAPKIETAPRTASPATTVATGDLTFGYASLPTATNADFQQLRSRSLYIDNLSSDLRAVITCIENESDPILAMGCESGDVKLDRTGSTNILELIPFFEVQTTFLNDWQKENVGGREFELTNEPVTTSDANGPTHSRGLVINDTSDGPDMVHTIVNRGVTGLTSSDPISEFNVNNVLPTPATGWAPGDVEVITGGVSPTLNGRVITGTLSSEIGSVKAANVTITATNATCNYITSSGLFTCFIPTSTNTPTITLSGFDKPPKTIYLCSSHQFGTPAELPVDRPDLSRDPEDVILTNASDAPAEPYSLWLTEDACPSAPCVGLACG